MHATTPHRAFWFTGFLKAGAAGPSKGWEEDASAGLAAASAERAYEALALAAPTKGDVLPWVWLLRAFADRWSVASMATGIAYLVRARPFLC